MTEKKTIFEVYVSLGNGETLVRRGGITKSPFDSILTQHYLCQKLVKSVNEH